MNKEDEIIKDFEEKIKSEETLLVFLKDDKKWQNYRNCLIRHTEESIQTRKEVIEAMQELKVRQEGY